MSIVGDSGFEVALNGLNPTRLPSALEDPDVDGAPGIGPGNAATLHIRQVGESLDALSAELVIESDDPERAEVRVPLLGNHQPPCLTVSPPTIDFDAAELQGAPRQQVLTLTSCDAQPIIIRALDLEGDDVFSLARSETPAPLPPGGTTALVVGFDPRSYGEYNASISFNIDNDEAQRTIRVPARGVAAERPCPVAVADPIEATVEVGAPLTLSGAASHHTDENLQVVKWVWSILDAPERSQALLREPPGEGADDPTTPEVLFIADQPGLYQLELEVADVRACQRTTTVSIEATEPPRGLRVELLWDTPGNLDLHFFHPYSTFWFHEFWDCYPARPTHDWGEQGDPLDDPRIVVASEAPGQPEILELTTTVPFEEDWTGYRLNVYAAEVPNGQAVIPHVRVLWDGDLAFEGEGPPLFEDRGFEWMDIQPTGDGVSLIFVERDYQGRR
ncbi:MAG: hypothetical protein ACE366_03640 [Bradymonadia bacterium]